MNECFESESHCRSSFFLLLCLNFSFHLYILLFLAWCHIHHFLIPFAFALFCSFFLLFVMLCYRLLVGHSNIWKFSIRETRPCKTIQIPNTYIRSYENANGRTFFAHFSESKYNSVFFSLVSVDSLFNDSLLTMENL